MSRRRPRTAALVLALLGAALTTVPGAGSPAAASCAGPSLDVGAGPRPTVAPGEPLDVRGEGYLDGCDDTGACTSGCSACHREEIGALRGITLEVRQAGRRWHLATADAGSAGEVAWRTVLPSGLRSGRAVLRTDGGGRLVVDVGAPGR